MKTCYKTCYEKINKYILIVLSINLIMLYNNFIKKIFQLLLKTIKILSISGEYLL